MHTEIILTGSFGVGKSSLFNRFIHGDFNEQYFGTIGVRVNSRDLQVGDSLVSVKLWDIAGEVNQEKVPVNYFNDKDIIVYVVDLNRPFTFEKIKPDIKYLRALAPDSKISIVGNKTDLIGDGGIGDVQSNKLGVTFNWLVSAKTGENVMDMFEALARERRTA